MRATATIDAHQLVRKSSFAVVDPASIPIDLREGLALQVIVPERFEDRADLFPALVDLRDMSDEQHAKLAKDVAAWERLASTPYFSALLITSCPAIQVITHLARRMALTLPDGRLDVLRYHDPHVFRHLRWMLHERQLDSLLGPLEGWGWREPSGQWCMHARRLEHASVPPLLVSADQWPKLSRIADINAVLAEVKRAAPHVEDNAATAEQINRFLAQARETHGLPHREDRRLFAVQATAFHPRIHEHPSMLERIARCRDAGVRYGEVCTDLDNATLAEMCRDLESSSIGAFR